ncbi:MAG: M23 family metallopeptidase [Bryobacteraceae bacterium]|nr:M23 family metallopeptidase [Bryobacteraceae bacterium]
MRRTLLLWAVLLAAAIVLVWRVAPREDGLALMAQAPKSEGVASPPDTAAPPVTALPLAGLRRADLHDTYNESREQGGRVHEAIDIMAPRGTPVYAVTAGVIKKLYTSVPGGITIYQVDPGEQWVFYYGHLDRYADGLTEGQKVKAGDLIAYVGATGNASPDAPHLHLAIGRLTEEKKYWESEPINPFPLLVPLAKP